MTRPADPGATPTAARALAPDLARGGMLLLIALANAHVLLHGHPLGVRGYPAALDPLSAAVAAVQLVLVDGRAYPLFAVLVGYGVTQLARRRLDAGADPRTVVSLVRRRGGALLLIGLVHGLLLFPGDILGAYGLTTGCWPGSWSRARRCPCSPPPRSARSSRPSSPRAVPRRTGRARACCSPPASGTR
ncbi:MAG: hypothetical protein OJJ54_03150 [Pseudonocardia sp.]|nr:hypothetical protein [Pseudonocardia sp.]